MQNQIVQKAETYITDLLKRGLTRDHLYHNLQHTLSVRDAGQVIGQRYRMSEDELELLELAALFHDVGFTKTYNGHEDASKEMAVTFLQQENYPEERIEQVKDLIEITKVTVEPSTLLQKVMKDSDFNTYGPTYMEKSAALRHEWKVFLGENLDELQWLKGNYDFWNRHQFYTGEAQALYGEEKRKTLKKLRKELERFDEDSLSFSISSSKSAQMMIKTTLRNHIDLTNIADNKANIMLSINSLLITIAIPLLAGNLQKVPQLIYPAITLLVTCILAIIYATLATRPVKMIGTTDLEKIEENTTNLFFFGNFFKMSIADYKKGLKKVLKSETTLDDSIVTDLFWLGKALGYKFQRLRICYSIFMGGMIITVITFAVVLALS